MNTILSLPLTSKNVMLSQPLTSKNTIMLLLPLTSMNVCYHHRSSFGQCVFTVNGVIGTKLLLIGGWLFCVTVRGTFPRAAWISWNVYLVSILYFVRGTWWLNW